MQIVRREAGKELLAMPGTFGMSMLAMSLRSAAHETSATGANFPNA